MYILSKEWYASKWSIVKKHIRAETTKKAYYLKDTALLFDFKILFARNPIICFYE